ncbi:hypothetical protein DCO17_01740 [Polynucleobacter tropicus]|uniref:Glycosyltransferase RgtA/B/C/D-like domain-containing protein n=1 Tax=Polynucleobacter tropicus TaxID=1743174 RepID=A0A6M9PUU1_9BURK|nr:glycosyltransferase family 39 protein [Polynucleobacter tropicus]QKM64061.1 hypothetical protein DCO17_01740 [Polynucleobacter tropicus]
MKTIGSIRIILYILIAILGSVYISTAGDKVNWPDEKIYIEIATNLNKGQGYVNELSEPSAFRPPGYPFLISILYKAKSAPLIAKIANLIFLILTTYILEKIIRFTSPSGAIFTPLAIFAYPLFIYASGILIPQIFGSFLFILSIYCIFIAKRNYWNGIFCGIIIGFLALTIPTFFLFYLILLLILIAKNPNKKKSIYILLVFLFMNITIAPWIIRNSLLFNSTVFISTNSGINLLYSNSENTQYDSGTIDISKHTSPVKLNEAQEDEYYKKIVFNLISENPTRYIKLYFLRTLNYFNYKNNISNQSEVNSLKNLVLFFSYYPFLIIAILRISFFQKIKLSYIEYYFYLIYFGNALLSAIFFTRIRYRIPFDFILIAISCIAIGRYLDFQNSKNDKSMSYTL